MKPTKGRRKSNAQHKAVRTPLFAMQVVKPAKGKGSYSRKGRSRSEGSGKVSGIFSTALVACITP